MLMMMTRLNSVIRLRWRVSFTWCGLLVWLLSGMMVHGAWAKPNEALREYVVSETTAVLDELASSGDYGAATGSLEDLFGQVIAYGSLRDDALLFSETAMNLRMVRSLSGATAGTRAANLTLMREKPNLRDALMLVVPEDAGEAAEGYAVLDEFRESRFADSMDQFASLVAAVCFVQDGGFSRRVNENQPESAGALEIFGYYVNNEKKMQFGVRTLPPELLAFVVDTTATIGEMNWALARYAKDRNVGKRFFEVEYDYAHVFQGTPKKCTQAGYSLMSVLKYGGVCADQTYFAMSVGKALGIPTTYTRGRSAETSHAWVGFLEGKGRRLNWNSKSGRYPDYQSLRGTVLDPITRENIPESYVAILAELNGTETADRVLAVAFADGARFLREQMVAGDFPPGHQVWSAEARGGRGPKGSSIRNGTIENVESLLEAGLSFSPACLSAWGQVAELAGEGLLASDRLQFWSDHVIKLYGKKYADFAVDVIMPMIEGVTDAELQNVLWERAFKAFARQHDLAAEIRFKQGEMLEDEQNYKAAAKCYEDVISRFINSGAFVTQALYRIEALLHKDGRSGKVPALYGQVWKRVPMPTQKAPEFFKQSNWYVIGSRYAQTLKQAGQTREAAVVEAKLRKGGGG